MGLQHIHQALGERVQFDVQRRLLCRLLGRIVVVGNELFVVNAGRIERALLVVEPQRGAMQLGVLRTGRVAEYPA